MSPTSVFAEQAAPSFRENMRFLSFSLVEKIANTDKEIFVFERENKSYNRIITNNRAVWSLDYAARFLSLIVKTAERILPRCRSPPFDFDSTTTNRNRRNNFMSFRFTRSQTSKPRLIRIPSSTTLRLAPAKSERRFRMATSATQTERRF